MYNGRSGIFSWIAILSLLLMAASAARADDPRLYPHQERLDLRDTRLARISYLTNEASIQHAQSQDLDAAAINVPVAAGDLLYTGDNARLELQLNGGFVRLSDHTSLEVVELSAERYRFNLTGGSASFSWYDGRPQDIEVATPQCAVTINKNGIYRVNVQPSGETEVIVHKGEAELYGKGGQFHLREGRRANFVGEQADVEIGSNIITDYFDGFVAERDNLVIANTASLQYVGPNVFGATDLDLYGNWINISGYGWAWQPNGLPIGWAPYRNGRWIYYYPWGWTWIANEQWGWLPYHYGHWIYLVNYGWCWIPEDIGWEWSPGFVSWYWISINNINYICWHPNTSNWNNNPPTTTPSPKTVIPLKSGQPIEHHSKVPSMEIGPVGVRPDKLPEAGASMLSEKDFMRGVTPGVPGQDMIDRMRNGGSVQAGVMPRPQHEGIGSTAQLPRPSQEQIARPVFTHFTPAGQVTGNPRSIGETNSAPPAATTTTTKESVASPAPIVVPNSFTSTHSAPPVGVKPTETGNRDRTPAPSHPAPSNDHSSSSAPKVEPSQNFHSQQSAPQSAPSAPSTPSGGGHEGRGSKNQ